MNAHPAHSENSPIRKKIPLHGRNSRRTSAMSGAVIKLRLGASSCMAIALPQELGCTSEVIVARPEGRYNPDAIPVRRRPALRAHKLELNEVAMSASPRAAAESAMVFLWEIRDEMNPDPKSVIKYPEEMMRNSDPACA